MMAQLAAGISLTVARIIIGVSALTFFTAITVTAWVYIHRPR